MTKMKEVDCVYNGQR